MRIETLQNELQVSEDQQASLFYRAGYIETWGQGIQKICDECTALGAELPRYEILGTGIRLYFQALRNALIDQPKTPNRQDVGKDVGLEVGLAERDTGIGKFCDGCLYEDRIENTDNGR